MSRWDIIYQDQKYCIKEPAEEVVKFISYLEDSNAKKILDLGFGAGRHIIYLRHKGFNVYGTDISKVGLEITTEWLKKENLEAELKLADMTSIHMKTTFLIRVYPEESLHIIR